MTEPIVGIDLGTTNSAIAIVQEGKVEMIPVHGSQTMPSCVGLDPSGQLIVGPAAKNQLVAAPETTISSIKRKMGEGIKVALGDQSFSPEEISSFVLRELKQEAERYLGRTVNKAVITVPAFFQEGERKATQVAGELAGLDVVRIINEPTAAALAYGADQTAGEKMLVYDLGGGTFDVSVVVVEHGVVEVKASHGDTHLGGDDFDDLLIDHVVNRLKTEKEAELTLDAKTRARLKDIVERAKCELSDAPFTRLREEYVDGSHHLDLEIDRVSYEQLIQSLLEKTVSCMHQALQDAKLNPGDINKVMLVGGSTRTPAVQRLQKQRLQLEPHSEISPDLIVAMGAAIQGGIVSGQQEHSVLVDITPHTYSVETLQPDMGPGTLVCAPIIPRNTPLPASKSEAFETARDYQEAVDIKVYQGEFPFPDQNNHIGEFRVEGLSRKPAGNLILVHFSLDLNGMLEVTATEKITGLAKTVTMDIRGKGGVDAVEARQNIEQFLQKSDKRRSSQESLAGSTEEGGRIGLPGLEDSDETLEEAGAHSREGANVEVETEAESGSESTEDASEALGRAKDLRKRAEALLEQNISEEDREEIRQLLQQIRQAVSESDWETLEEKSNALSDLLFFLED